MKTTVLFATFLLISGVGDTSADEELCAAHFERLLAQPSSNTRPDYLNRETVDFLNFEPMGYSQGFNESLNMIVRLREDLDAANSEDRIRALAMASEAFDALGQNIRFYSYSMRIEDRTGGEHDLPLFCTVYENGCDCSPNFDLSDHE